MSEIKKIIGFSRNEFILGIISLSLIVLNLTQLNLPFWNSLSLIVLAVGLIPLMTDKKSERNEEVVKILQRKEYDYKAKYKSQLYYLVMFILIVLPNIFLHGFNLKSELIMFIIFVLMFVTLVWSVVANLNVLNKYFPTQIVRVKDMDLENPIFEIKMRFVSGKYVFTKRGIYQTLSSKFYNFYPWENFDYFLRNTMNKESLLIYKKKGEFIESKNKFGRRNNEYLILPLKKEYKDRLVEILKSKLKCLD